MPAPGPSPAAALSRSLDALFDAERDVRRVHAELVEATATDLLPILETTIQSSMSNSDEDERTLRLVRVAGLLAEIEGAKAVDLLIDILGAEDPEARHGAGVALEDRAYDRFKEVALGVERALERLQPGQVALAELPYLLADIPEPGVMKLLGRFLAHADAEAVGAAIESLVEIGDPSAAPLLAPLMKDKREVTLEDDEGEEGKVTVGELAEEAREILLAAAGQGSEPRGGKR
jgi:HEAT repeat protein